MFLYYYYIDLIYCVFCNFYIFCKDYDEDFENINIISGEYSFICSRCLKIFNKLFFINNYCNYNFLNNNLNKKNQFFSYKKDNYNKYFYCYFNCFTCYLYFNNCKNYLKLFCCEFFKKNYYNKILDNYNNYFYCTIYKCEKCFIYYGSEFDCIYWKILKFYYKEFNLSYWFYKKQEDIFLNIISPEEIFFFLNKFVIGQTNAKKIISISLYNHYKKIKLNFEYDLNLSKSNILIIGPSGSGKTFLIKTLSKIIDIPIIIVDATTFTETGYVGEDVENIIQKLFEESCGDLKLTEIGIVFIDEIDKISSKNINNGRDISGQGVQQSLLKIIESTVCQVFDYNNYEENFNFYYLNTENILFICGGAFQDIYLNEENLSYFYNKFEIFNSDILISFGLIPELIGRLPIIIILDNLNVNFLKKILFNSENSLLNDYNKLLFPNNINLFLSTKSVECIAKIAQKKGLGSRGLKGIMDGILMDIMYKIPNLDNLIKIIIHDNIFFLNNNGPILQYDF